MIRKEGWIKGRRMDQERKRDQKIRMYKDRSGDQGRRMDQERRMD